MNIPKKFIGEKIYHKTLKFGSIIDCTDLYILVRFDNETCEQIPHKFQFPDIMFDNRNLITTESKVILDFLAMIKTNHTCLKCGKQVIDDLSLNSHHFCSVCVSQMILCSECGKFFERNECVTDDYGESLCKNCAQTTRFYCSHCNTLRPLSELIQSPYIPEEQKICGDCIEWMDYISCSCCGEYVPEEIIEEIDGYYLCPQCKETQTGRCHICGELTVLKNVDAAITCTECSHLIAHQEFIGTLDFSTLKIASIPFSIFKASKTIKLMSRLRHSYGDAPKDKTKEPIDILLIETYHGALVVCYDAPQNSKYLYHYGCTLTTLKKEGPIHLFSGNTCVIKRELPVPSLGKTFYVWERPYRLDAQTISDMDYGDRWEGQALVYEGNKYGDTSAFIILGFIR